MPRTKRRRGAVEATRLRRALAAAAVASSLLAGVAACGASGSTSSSSGSGSVRGYLACLSEHAGQGPRKACRSDRPPASALEAMFQSVTSCLRSHGVTLTSPAAGSGSASASSGELKSLLALRSGTASQRAAFSSCTSRAGG